MAKVTQVNDGDSGLVARTAYNEAIKNVETDATINGDGIDTPLSAVPDASKADKVGAATDGNFAGLNATGNLTDSGSKSSDFATAAQGTKADTATQPGDNVSTLTNDAGYIDSAGAPVQSVATKTGAVVLDADDVSETASKKWAGETGADVLKATDQQDWISGIIESPTDKDYSLVVKAYRPGEIKETATQSVSGTCTATFKINNIALGGTPNPVSPTLTSQTHATANTFVEGDLISVTISANASTVDMSFSMKLLYNLL